MELGGRAKVLQHGAQDVNNLLHLGKCTTGVQVAPRAIHRCWTQWQAWAWAQDGVQLREVFRGP